MLKQWYSVIVEHMSDRTEEASPSLLPDDLCVALLANKSDLGSSVLKPENLSNVCILNLSVI